MDEQDIYTMNLSELKKEVQRLRDELAKMQRYYNDILYNLDAENFSDNYTQTQGEISSNVTKQITELETKTKRMASLKTTNAITDLTEVTDPEQVYKLITKNGNNKVTAETYYYYDKFAKKPQVISKDTIYTVFTPPAQSYSEGFLLRNNVIIDGNNGITTRNLNLTGEVVWGDSFPLKAQYSVDGTSWHDEFLNEDSYMRIWFKSGTKWSEPIQIN